MDELLELVEDEENGRAHLNLTAQQVHKCRKPFLFEHAKSADIIQAVRDDRFVEKAELPDMQQPSRKAALDPRRGLV